MNSPGTTVREKPSPRRLLVVIGGVVLTIVVAMVVALVLFLEDAGSEQSAKGADCCWRPGTTPAWVRERIGLGVPGAAGDLRGGYRAGERYDVGILAFTLSRREADAYLAPLNPAGTRMIPNVHPEAKGYRPTAPFAHVGLPEPETLVRGLRKGGFCPGDVAAADGKDVVSCVDLFAHEFEPGRTRIYVRATIEPPAASETPAPGGGR
ncbi:hypothetical protein M1P56_33530 [Streptomyces sp. HU2014]|uniref:hypothetical protein n=1 Tax=Streptomyces sp. HU2014 TaxID=2939414 RepID=UPI00200CB46C|nr:hypothetical protein [Streptomyces sp. HU2014]UQI48887.1 hypothetical protein M1P56_33530 [Streptomyces sp. HU2014]